MSAAPAYRTALVTGASSGIGRALAVRLARGGVGLLALAARREDSLHDAAREVREAGGRALVVPLDVGDGDRTARVVADLDREMGGLDLVVANAGAGAAPGAPAWAWETMREALHTNFCGAAATLTGALGGMTGRRRGHLVGIGSLASYGALPESAAYCAPKAGLAMLLECLAVDLAEFGVGVTHVRLGFVATPMVARSTHPMPQIMSPEAAADTIALRLPSRPREIVLPRALGAAARAAGALPHALRNFALRRARGRL